MPQLHKKQRALLQSYVRTFQVGPTRNLDSPYNAEYAALWQSIGKDGPWREWLDEFDLSNIARFAFDPISDQVPTGFTGPLDDHLLPAVEDQMRLFLESIPRPYHVCFELSRFSKYGVPQINLSSNVCIIETINGAFEGIVSQTDQIRGLFALGSEPGIKLKPNTVYLRFFVPGYTNWSLSSYSPARAFARLKHLFVLGSIDGRLRHSLLEQFVADTSSSFVSRPNVHVVAYNPDNPDRESYQLHFPDQATKYVSWFRINDENLTVHDGKNATTLLVGRPAETTMDKAEALPFALASTMRLQDLDDSNKDADRIRAALEWYFDADTAENSTVAFLQRCIGLEAILGDDENSRTSPLTDRLADRYAYLMGRTPSERSELRGQFREVYGHRSDVIHSRKAAGSVDFRTDAAAKAMLANVISREYWGLIRSLGQSKGSGTN